MINKAFGKILRRLRKKHHWTQEDLAQKAQLHRGYLSHLERGVKSPSLTTMDILARTLGISLGDFIKQVEAEIQQAKAVPVYIYALADPNTDIVYYIGQSRNPQSRFSRHLSEARTGKKASKPLDAKATWIAKLLAKEQKPTLKILEETNAAEASIREAHWIVQMFRQNQPLTNKGLNWQEIRRQGFNPHERTLQLPLFE